VEAETLVFLAAAGFVAAFIDSQVGGGGVISLPALLAVGLPPHLALGTNKLAATSASFTASINYGRSGAVPWGDALRWMPLAFVGSLLGVWLVLKVEGLWLLRVVLALMVAMVVYVLLRPSFGKEDRSHPLRMWELLAMSAAALAIGVYDGFLGPGTGSFLLFAIVSLLGYGFRKAAGLGRVLNYASNIGALAYFLGKGQVLWEAGIPMGIAMLAGGWVGSHVGLTHGDRWLKPLFVTVTLVLMVRVGGRLAGWW
jgi:uncharacterized membrane protein YfcA